MFRPIGIHSMTMMAVSTGGEEAGVPLMASGLRLSIDDVGKITTLLQNGGTHNGRQLLHSARLSDALYQSGQLTGLPTGKSFADGHQAYHSSFWSTAHRAETGTYYQVPFMSGAGGITIFLAPNGVSTFVFTDSGHDTYSLNSPAVAEAIRPYPGDGLANVSLLPKESGSGSTAVLAGIVLAIIAIGGLLAWRILRRRAGHADRGSAADRP